MKSKRICEGYPNPDDLVFQHQTTVTIKKARSVEAARKRSAASSPASESSLALIPNPRQSVETVATSFYLGGIIIEPSSAGRCVGHLEFLPRLYLKASSDSALARVTNATCLAALSNFGTVTSPIMKQALEEYGHAVVSLYQAMKDSELRTKNEVLMAVMLMNALESMLAWRKAPTLQWSTHTMGAVGLLKSRGNAVLDDPVASRIFMVVRQFVQRGSDSRGQPLDPFFSQTVSNLVKIPDCPEVRLSQITRGMYVLRQRTLLALQHGDRGTLAVRLSELEWMDEALAGWTTMIPESYQYESTDSPVDPEDMEFNLQEHRYRDPWFHRIWNTYRCSRIFANVLAYRCLLALGEDDGLDCLQNMHTMADEICSSIPSEMRDVSIPGSPFHLTSGQEAVMAFYMQWPLLIAMGVLTLPQSQRSWIRKRMVGIAEKYQIRRAMSLIEAHDQDERRPLFLDDWGDDIVENLWESSFLYGSGVI
jgi:hypothetical protein